ncbi:MAG: Trm112 family protein [Desulfovibrio sp.]|nr:Trm112 family protein [Desulfovibrio sp.]
MDKDFLALLACPRCRSSLSEVSGETRDGLYCAQCAVVYPIEDGIPVLLVEEGVSRNVWEEKESPGASGP